MASDFVRNIKGVRNINKLSSNITTENDLISTIDGEVYVVTKKGYKNITNVETQDFEKLKTKVENLKNQSENNTTDIDGLQTDVSNNTTDIGTLKTDVSNNTTDIGTLKTDVNTNTTDIGTLKTDVSTNTTDIGTLQTDVSNNTSEIETLKTTTGNNTSEIKGVKSEQTNFENRVTDLETFKDEQTTTNEVQTTKNEEIEKRINTLVSNSGWENLPLTDGITAYSDEEIPQYKVCTIGDTTEVSIRGAVKGVTDNRVVVAELPIEKSLSQQHVYLQPTSLKENVDGEKIAQFIRIAINKDKQIEIQNFSFPKEYISKNDWCPLNTTFKL